MREFWSAKLALRGQVLPGAEGDHEEGVNLSRFQRDAGRSLSYQGRCLPPRAKSLNYVILMKMTFHLGVEDRGQSN